MSNQGNQNLEIRIQELEEKLNRLEQHSHLGDDGSKPLNENTELRVKRILIPGAGTIKADYVTIPLEISDANDLGSFKKRTAGHGLLVNNKGGSTEQARVVLNIQKATPDIEELPATNKADFSEEINEVQLLLNYFPQGGSFESSGLTFPPSAQLYAVRTPLIVNSTGLLSFGGSTFTDSNANFTASALVGCYIQLTDNLETHQIESNTDTTITIDGTWSSDSAEYAYTVFSPVQLGSANYPWIRLFVGSDIRLGYGATGDSQVQFIKWGSGVPNRDVDNNIDGVNANIGSLYLQRDGSSSSTLWVKEANDIDLENDPDGEISSTGWRKVNTTAP